MTVKSADGTRLAVRRMGSGESMVLLHGSGGGLHSWQAVADDLAGDYEVWLVARRGFGPSDVPDGANSFPAEIEDVRAILARARTESGRDAVLVGASSGATLGLHTALADPGGIRALCLYEPPLFAAGPGLVPALQQYERLVAGGDLAGAAVVFAQQVARVPAPLLAALAAADDADDAEASDDADASDSVEAARSAIGSLHDLQAMAADSEDIARWSGVRVPTLLMQGADSWDPLPATMDALAAVLPNVERAIWDGQMHFATMTAPGLVAATIRRFVQHLDDA